MAKYVSLYQFTDKGIRDVKDSPARLKAGIQKAESVGIKTLGVYYTQGQYDVVVISEAADEKTATAFALAQAAQGNVRSITLRAFDAAEFEAIVKLMP
jgi:uncharacterized protein with GYD domain